MSRHKRKSNAPVMSWDILEAPVRGREQHPEADTVLAYHPSSPSSWEASREASLEESLSSSVPRISGAGL